MSTPIGVNTRFFEPPQFLRRYFNTFFFTEIALSDGEVLTDFLMPSWGIVNYRSPGSSYSVEYSSGETFAGGVLTITGPFCRAARLTVGPARHWGLGLLPAGWARFIGAPARRYANRSADGFADQAFVGFRPLAGELHGDSPDCEADLPKIERHFSQLHARTSCEDEDRIVAIYEALQDPRVTRASELAERAGVNLRTLERVCDRAYGFPPKMLLRRQRFMRSMALHSLDPTISWTDAMDDSYHDQAQFVREFREFMGVSPTEYNARERPLASPLIKERAAHILASPRNSDQRGA